MIKADGLAAGRSSLLKTRIKLAQRFNNSWSRRPLAKPDLNLIVEEFLQGKEASFHVFADSSDFVAMVAAQDHKRRFDGDNGPNTGGMGAYSVDTILSREQQDAVLNRIIRPTLKAAGSYSGVLYAGLMLTAEGPKLLEYNVRFGDPETQVILSRLENDLAGILAGIAEHRLSSTTVEWRNEPAATVVLVAREYPGRWKAENGFRLEEAKRIEHVKVYHAGIVGTTAVFGVAAY